MPSFHPNDHVMIRVVSRGSTRFGDLGHDVDTDGWLCGGQVTSGFTGHSNPVVPVFGRPRPGGGRGLRRLILVTVREVDLS